MIDAEQISEMDIEALKANFSCLMDAVVQQYGDNQEEEVEQEEEADATN